MYSVMWSEHCSYKSSRIYLRTLPTEGPHVLVGPGEGAGIVQVDGVAVALRIESHNHPSFIEPVQGAETGVGGIVRDILSVGARPIALYDPLRFGPLPVEGATDPAIAERNRFLVEGVVSGISTYGNCIGVPTVGGEVVFDDCYSGNPLVNVMCIGVAPVERIMLARAHGPGNVVLLLGSPTGRDGIGGVSVLASSAFDERSETKRPSVQVGDPFTEKLLIEACLELMERGVVVGIQDLGGKKVCATTGSTSIDHIAQAASKPIPYPLADFTDCLVAFQNGEVDAIATDDAILAGLAAQDPYAKIIGDRFSDEPYGIGIALDHPEFTRFVNGVLDQMRANGTWAKLYTQWLVPSLSSTVPPPPAPVYRD